MPNINIIKGTIDTAYYRGKEDSVLSSQCMFESIVNNNRFGNYRKSFEEIFEDRVSSRE